MIFFCLLLIGWIISLWPLSLSAEHAYSLDAIIHQIKVLEGAHEPKCFATTSRLEILCTEHL